MAKNPRPKGRYEIREPLGEGGMGVVYRAYDPVLRREVSLKTIRDAQDEMVLELFKRECAVLAGLGHPNIVEIFDIGESDEGDGKRPYFVMPLLRGATLDNLIRTASPRLTLDRTIGMVAQTCRGLQAAHDQGLVHRDLKPANIFVLEDDSIKVIDFGVAHLTDQRSVTGLKGTLLYMAPEQLQLKKPSPLSDQFSLAVISYEMLTRRHPFNVPGHEDLAQAIINFSPPPVSEINPLVPALVSQVIHKALAKEPFHRFATVREYADCLQKALRNEPIEIFDPARVEPRLVRAQKAFADGDWEFAAEIVRELKSESYLNPEIERLDKELSEATLNKSVKQLLETARRRFDEHEYLLALQKVQEVCALDPGNVDAITLQGKIENTRSTTQVAEWLRLAQQHLDNRAYTHARQALEKVIDLHAGDSRAKILLSEIDRQEQDYIRQRTEKQQAYQAALKAFQRGDVNSAMSKLERCLGSDRNAANTTSVEEATAYQKLYEEVRSKRDHLQSQEAEAKRLLGEDKFDEAFALCSEVLKEYPDHIVFSVLRDDAEQGQRKEISAFVANVERDVAGEADIDRKVAILEAAQAKYPQEQRFEQSLRQVRSRKSLVDSIVKRAQAAEDAGQFSDALAQWETLSNIHSQYPGLKIEIERVTRRRQQQSQSGARASWVTQIDQAVNIHNYAKAAGLVRDALGEFPGDAELLALDQTVAQLSRKQVDAEEQLARAKELDGEGRTDEGLELLRETFRSVPHHQAVRNGLLDLLLKRAGALLDSNWAAADPYVNEAVSIEPKNALAKSLRTLIGDKRQAEEVAQCLAAARSLQGQGKGRDAVRELDQGLSKYPRETRLIQLRTSFGRGLSATEQQELRTSDLEELRKLDEASRTETDARSLDTIFQRTRIFGSRYGEDREFRDSVTAIQDRITTTTGRAKPGFDVFVPPSPPPDEPEKRKNRPTPPDPLGSASLVSKKPAQWRQIAFAGGGALAVGLVILLFFTLKNRPAEPPPGPTVTQIAITNATGGYRIEDSTGKDVTAEAAGGGVAPGEFHLRASRAGFLPVDMAFTVKAGERRHEEAIAWQALPVQVVVRGPFGVGMGTIGDQPFVAGPNGDATAQVGPGQHMLHWAVGNFTADALLDVKDGAVAASGWTFKPNGRALFVAAETAALHFDAVNFDKITVNGKPSPLTNALPPPAKETPLEFRGGVTLLKTPPTDNAYSATVYIAFALAPGKAAARPADTPAATTPQAVTPEIAPAPPAAAPAKTQRELEKERKLREFMEKTGVKQ